MLALKCERRYFLIGCMFFFVYFYSAHAIHPLFDSRLLIDCQWFFKTAGKSDRQKERGQQIALIQFLSFLSMVRDKVLLKKAGLDFWKVGVWTIKYRAPVEFQWFAKKSRHEGIEKACACVEARSYIVIYAIYLLAACIKLLYGQQEKVIVVASPEFLPHPFTYGRLSSSLEKICIQKSTWLTHFVYISKLIVHYHFEENIKPWTDVHVATILQQTSCVCLHNQAESTLVGITTSEI